MLYPRPFLRQNYRMHRLTAVTAALAVFLGAALDLHAGGGGMNVAVIVNGNSSNSVQLGNYYMERRHVPSQNLLRTTWTGGNVVWTLVDFSNVIYVPFQAMLASRQLTNQIDYVVLSMDFPYATSLAGNSRNNSTTST